MGDLDMPSQKLALREVYTDVLGIPGSTEDPDYYQLLGIQRFTRNASDVHDAALGQMKKIRRWLESIDSGDGEVAEAVLRKVSFASTTLENEERKEAYDRELAAEVGVDLNDSEDYVALDEQVPLQDCPECGAPMSFAAVFCIECDARVEEELPLPPPPPPDEQEAEEDEAAGTEDAQVAESPAAKMGMPLEVRGRAGLAFWAVLTVLMSVYCGTLGLGLAVAGPLLLLVAGLYLAAALWPLLYGPDPIAADDGDERGKRLYSIAEELARRGGIQTPTVATAEVRAADKARIDGFTFASARIVVDRKLVEEEEMGEAELEVVLAHQMGHLVERDYLAANLLRPARNLVDMAGGRLVQKLDPGQYGVGAVGFALLSLVLVIGLGAGVVFAPWLAALGVALFVGVLTIKSFERSRHFEADQQAIDFLGGPEALVRFLEAQISPREDEGADTESEQPQDMAAPDGTSGPMSIAVWLLEGGFLRNYPTAADRLHHISRPPTFRHPLTRAVRRFGLLIGDESEKETDGGWKAFWLGAVAGAGIGVVLSLGTGLAFYCMAGAIVLLGGIAYALLTALFDWKGARLLRGGFQSSYGAATLLLVIGTLTGHAAAFYFPLLFPIMLIVCWLLAVLGWIIRNRRSQSGGANEVEAEE